MSAASSRDNASLGSPSTLHTHPTRVLCVAPLDNERVVSVSDDTIIVWKLGSDKEERHWDHKGAMSIAVSPDGKYIVSGGRNGDLQLWDVASSRNFSGPWKLHTDKVSSVIWFPDGNRIASCSEDGTFIIWNVRLDSPTIEHFLGPISAEQDALRTIAYCTTRTKLATGGHDSTVKVWNAETGALQVTLAEHSMSISSVALTENILISGSVDGAVRVWDISESEQNAVRIVSKKTITDSAAIQHVAVSERFFSTASYNDISLRSLTTYDPPVASFKFPKGDEPNCIALSADEKTLIAGTEKGKVYTWNIGGFTSTFNGFNDDGYGFRASIVSLFGVAFTFVGKVGGLFYFRNS